MKWLPVAILIFLFIFSCQPKKGNNKEGETEKIIMNEEPDYSLQSKLDSFKNNWLKKADSQKIVDYQRGIDILEEEGIGNQALKVGDTAIDFTLSNAVGNKVHLYKLVENGPVVIIWYRGGWCPYCNLELAAYQDYLKQIKNLGATLIAISPNLPDNSMTTIEKHQLEYEVLSDINNETAKLYGISYKLPEIVQKHFEGKILLDKFNGNANKELPLAATFIVDMDKIIKYTFIDKDYRKRAEPSEIIEVLERL
jgi:peroxiredoxin